MSKPSLFFNRKFPFQYTPIRSIIIISLSIGIIMFIMQPFGFINYNNNKIIASLGFALVTFFSLTLMNFIKKSLIRKKVKKWTMLREILYLLSVIIVIAIANMFYLSLIIDSFQLNILTFITILFYTASIGFFPILFFTVLRYNGIVKKDLGILINDNMDDKDAMPEDEPLRFTSLNKTDKELVLTKKNFMFVESIKNQVYIYFYDNEIIKTISLRNTLSNIEKEIQDNSIIRCHRSFIINTNNIKTATGNSNGYKVYFKHYNKFVPVSRSYADLFRKMIY